MKNKEITIYELLGLIKDDKAPKKIKYSSTIWILNKDTRQYERSGVKLFIVYKVEAILNNYVEILDEENDKFEDIEEYELPELFVKDDYEVKFNKLIRNQKLLISKVGELDERNMD